MRKTPRAELSVTCYKLNIVFNPRVWGSEGAGETFPVPRGEVVAGHSPRSPAALLPSSSRLTWVITEDGLSITSRGKQKQQKKCRSQTFKAAGGSTSPPRGCMNFWTTRTTSEPESAATSRPVSHSASIFFCATSPPLSRSARKESRSEGDTSETFVLRSWQLWFNMVLGAPLANFSRSKHGGFKAAPFRLKRRGEGRRPRATLRLDQTTHFTTVP